MNIFSNLFKIWLLLFFFSLISSCIITRTPGFYSGYKRLPLAQKKRIVIIKDKDPLPQLVDSVTYAITAKHLMQVVKAQAPCVIYLWSAHCSGKACISIPAFRQFCQTNGYNAVVYSEYYDFEQLSIQGVAPSSVFAINNEHYGTDYCNKYVHRFQQSLFNFFDKEFTAKYYYKYIYYDGKTLTASKPSNLDKYPWQ